MIYGYCRCSTNETKQDITRQIRDLKALGVEDKNNIFKEYESGTKINRVELNRLLNTVKPGDTIIATEASNNIFGINRLLKNKLVIEKYSYTMIKSAMMMYKNIQQREP